MELKQGGNFGIIFRVHRASFVSEAVEKDKKRKSWCRLPSILVAYNKHIGGVNLAVMLIELYRTPVKAKRWYFRIFGQCLDISVINAWLLFRRHHEGTKVTLKHFRSSLGEALLYAGKQKRGRPSLDAEPSKRRAAATPHPVEDVHLDGIAHWPTYGKKDCCAKCKKGFSTMHCTKCDKMLCLVPTRNCFISYRMQLLFQWNDASFTLTAITAVCNILICSIFFCFIFGCASLKAVELRPMKICLFLWLLKRNIWKKIMLVSHPSCYQNPALLLPGNIT